MKNSKLQFKRKLLLKLLVITIIVLPLLYVVSWYFASKQEEYAVVIEKNFLGTKDVQVYCYTNGALIKWISQAENGINSAYIHIALILKGAISSAGYSFIPPLLNINYTNLNILLVNIYYPLESVASSCGFQSKRMYNRENAKNIINFNKMSEEEKIKIWDAHPFRNKYLCLMERKYTHLNISQKNELDAMKKKYEYDYIDYTVNLKNENKGPNCCGVGNYNTKDYSESEVQTLEIECSQFIQWCNRHDLAVASIALKP